MWESSKIYYDSKIKYVLKSTILTRMLKSLRQAICWIASVDTKEGRKMNEWLSSRKFHKILSRSWLLHLNCWIIWTICVLLANKQTEMILDSNYRVSFNDRVIYSNGQEQWMLMRINRIHAHRCLLKRKVTEVWLLIVIVLDFFWKFS